MARKHEKQIAMSRLEAFLDTTQKLDPLLPFLWRCEEGRALRAVAPSTEIVPAVVVAAPWLPKLIKQTRHRFFVSRTEFIIDTHYKPIKQMGSGAFGVAWYAHGFVSM